MKKVCFAAVAAVLVLTGCTNDELLNQSTDKAIQFKTLETVSTRSVERGVNDLVKDGFSVYAFYQDGTNAIDYTKPYMNGVPVEMSGTDWVYSPLKYWPKETEQKIEFFAHSGLTWGTATVKELPVEASGGSDVLVAKHAPVNTPNAKVTMNFHHALSQIVVSARSGKETVLFEISSIKLTSVLPDGDADLAGWSPAEPDGSIPAGNGLKWTASGTPTDYALELKEDVVPVEYSTDNWTDVTQSGSGIIVIPQELTDDVTKIEVTYIAKDADTGLVIEKETTATVSVNLNLLPGLKYRLNLTLNGLGLNPIEFDEPTVVDWKDATPDAELNL